MVIRMAHGSVGLQLSAVARLLVMINLTVIKPKSCRIFPLLSLSRCSTDVYCVCMVRSYHTVDQNSVSLHDVSYFHRFGDM